MMRQDSDRNALYMDDCGLDGFETLAKNYGIVATLQLSQIIAHPAVVL
jgi:hypothetical protein